MAERTVYTCDRCGKEIDWFDKRHIQRVECRRTWWSATRKEENAFDLCLECNAKLDEFLKGEKKDA